MYKVITTTAYNKYVKKDIKILHISDIHYSGIKDRKRLNKLYKKISTYKVDYICITGDTINSNNIVEKRINRDCIISFLNKISMISKVIISLGNHDIFTRVGKDLKKYYDKEFFNMIRNIKNVYLLDNEYYSDDDVYIYGYTQSFNYYYKYKKEDKNIMLNEINKLNINNNLPDKLRICLMHSPICLEYDEVVESLDSYDLILSGHMHNGIVLPIIDELFDNNVGLVSPGRKLFPKIARGVINKNNIVIVSPGTVKFAKDVSIFIRWANILFPNGINIIKVSNKNTDTSISYKYEK